jgi:hypothetical protein
VWKRQIIKNCCLLHTLHDGAAQHNGSMFTFFRSMLVGIEFRLNGEIFPWKGNAFGDWRYCRISPFAFNRNPHWQTSNAEHNPGDLGPYLKIVIEKHNRKLRRFVNIWYGLGWVEKGSEMKKMVNCRWERNFRLEFHKMSGQRRVECWRVDWTTWQETGIAAGSFRLQASFWSSLVVVWLESLSQENLRLQVSDTE